MRLLQGLLHNELTMRGLQSSLAALEVEPAGYYQLLLLDLGLSDKNAPERDALTQTVVQHLPPAGDPHGAFCAAGGGRHRGDGGIRRHAGGFAGGFPGAVTWAPPR